MTATTSSSTNEYSGPLVAGKANKPATAATDGECPVLRTRDLKALIAAADAAASAGQNGLLRSRSQAWDDLCRSIDIPPAGRSIALALSIDGRPSLPIPTPAAPSIPLALDRLAMQLEAEGMAGMPALQDASSRIEISAPPLPGEHTAETQCWRGEFAGVVAHEPARGNVAFEVDAVGAVDAEIRVRDAAARLGRSDPRNFPLHLRVMSAVEIVSLREIGPPNFDDAGDAFKPRDPWALRQLIERVAARRLAERREALASIKARLARQRRIALGREIIARIEGRSPRLPPTFA